MHGARSQTPCAAYGVPFIRAVLRKVIAVEGPRRRERAPRRETAGQ